MELFNGRPYSVDGRLPREIRTYDFLDSLGYVEISGHRTRCCQCHGAYYLLYADNEPSAEVYGAAADRQQASIVFDVAKQMHLLTIGTINDMYTEMQSDENQGAYSTLASQDDMDRF